MTKRWAETLNAEPEEERSADEIAADIIKRAGLVFGDGDIDEPV